MPPLKSENTIITGETVLEMITVDRGSHADASRPTFLQLLMGQPSSVQPRAIGRDRPETTLVTGGAGFVGTNVADALLRRGERVRILDSLVRPGVEENLRWLRATHGPRLEFICGDIRDRDKVRMGVRDVSCVFHFAAQVAVTTSVEDPTHDFEVNLGGTVALLDELRALPHRPSLFFTSTNKVYGSLPDVRLERVHDRWVPSNRDLREHGIGESRRLDFCTPYGCSKGGADQYVLDWAKTYGMRAVVFRMSCIYGPHQQGNEDQGWVAHFLLRALAAKRATIFGDGAQVRDVLHVEDLVRAFLLARDGIDATAGRAFNIGGGAGNTLSLLELLDSIDELRDVRPTVEFAPERIGDQRWYVSDPRAFAAATGWTPQISVSEGVADLYRWLAETGTRHAVPA